MNISMMKVLSTTKMLTGMKLMVIKVNLARRMVIVKRTLIIPMRM
jgi:hypothetical protein